MANWLQSAIQSYLWNDITINLRNKSHDHISPAQDFGKIFAN